jgi:hypothetical protein
MGGESDKQSSVGRSAVLLFVASVVGFVAVWVLNASLYTYRNQYKAARKALNERERMLERLQLHRDGGADFYERVLQSFVAPINYTSDEEQQYLEKRLEWVRTKVDLRQLSEKVAEINSSEPERARREKLIKDTLGPFLRSLTPPMFVNNECIALFADSRAPTSWRAVSHFIVHGRTKKLREIYMSFEEGPNDGISFVNRTAKLWGPSEQKELLHKRLVFDGNSKAEAILTADYIDASQHVADTPKNTLVAVSDLADLKVSITDALYILPVILLVLAMQFLVVRNAGGRPPALQFPQYKSPNDPMLALGGITAHECLQRVLWAGFLVIPLLFTIVGLIFRYDFVTPLAASGSPLELAFWAVNLRSATVLDAALDTLNMAGAIMLLVFIYLCTSPSSASDALGRRWSRISAAALIIVSLFAFVAITERLCLAWFLKPWGIVEPRFLRWYSIGTVWLFLLALFCNVLVGIARNRRFSVWLCMTLLFVLLVSVLMQIKPALLPTKIAPDYEERRFLQQAWTE